MGVAMGSHVAAERRVHVLGLLTVALGAALGVGMFAWLAGAGTTQAAWISAPLRAHSVEPPRPAEGLVERPDNRGQVLFGRYCDSCHPAGREVLGASLRSRQFKRQFDTDEKIVRIIREGGFDMPAFPKTMISDEDVALIAAFVRQLPEESR